MNPFILCPGGPNGSSDAQIELKEQIWICETTAMRCLREEFLARMTANGARLSVEESSSLVPFPACQASAS